MPDITMCNSDVCPMRTTCYRNEASGTKPCEWRQSYFMAPPLKDDGTCGHFWDREARYGRLSTESAGEAHRPLANRG